MTPGGNVGLFCYTQDLAANVKIGTPDGKMPFLVRYERDQIEKNGHCHQKERSPKPGKKKVKSRPNRRQNKHKITLNFLKEK